MCSASTLKASYTHALRCVNYQHDGVFLHVCVDMYVKGCAHEGIHMYKDVQTSLMVCSCSVCVCVCVYCGHAHKGCAHEGIHMHKDVRTSLAVYFCRVCVYVCVYV